MKSKRILFLVNHEIVIYNFRKELVEALLKENDEVFISSPTGPKTERLKDRGAHIIPTLMNRHSKNPFSDFKLLMFYIKQIKKIKPDVVLTYTIKPNIYGGIAARFLKVKYISTITGLGNALNNGLKSALPHLLYRVSLKKAYHVYLQNQSNLNYMLERRILNENYSQVNGSGVNVEDFAYTSYPKGETLIFLYVGRLMKAKGIEEYLKAAATIKKRHPNTAFHIVGSLEEDYQSMIHDAQDKNIIIYHGPVLDPKPYYQKAHALIVPSYHEGLSNVLLEAGATGRPLIASNIPGCKEVIQDHETGLLFDPKNSEDLIEKLEEFIELSLEKKAAMGKKSRVFISKIYNRNSIVENYMKRIHSR